MHEMHRQIRILGAYIDRVTLDEAVQRAREFVAAGRPHQIVTVNVDFLRLAQENTEFMGVINRSELAIADGMPLVWASRWMGDALPERVTGVELVDKCCEFAAEEGYRVFLLGGADGIPEAAAEILKSRHPRLQVAGTYSPPIGEFSDEEDRKIVDMINAAQPHILLVAFGAPKQDIWIAQHRDQISVPLAVGVGGVFNFLTGRVKRAPAWMQDRGLEWLYRVLQEPRRLWRRYFLLDMPVLVGMGVDALLSRVATPTPRTPVISATQPQLSDAPVNVSVSSTVPPHLPADPLA
jgi:N-acetylglucosaminyldiphosphoundecaprenol N-acetyl-beta-D-mannosaminyltransferase